MPESKNTDPRRLALALQIAGMGDPNILTKNGYMARCIAEPRDDGTWTAAVDVTGDDRFPPSRHTVKTPMSSEAAAMEAAVEFAQEILNAATRT